MNINLRKQNGSVILLYIGNSRFIICSTYHCILSLQICVLFLFKSFFLLLLSKMSFKFKIPFNHFYTNRKVCIKYCTTCLWALEKVIVVKNSNKLTLCNYKRFIFLLAEILSVLYVCLALGVIL